MSVECRTRTLDRNGPAWSQFNPLMVQSLTLKGHPGEPAENQDEANATLPNKLFVFQLITD